MSVSVGITDFLFLIFFIGQGPSLSMKKKRESGHLGVTNENQKQHFIDFENHIENIKKISNSINTKLLDESNNYEKWYEDVISKMNFIIQCQQDFEEKICKIQMNSDKAKTMKEQLEKDLDEKSQKLAEIQDEYKNKVDECEAFKKEYENQERLCQATREQTKLSQKDKDVLSTKRKKYEMYKEITNIVWDYSIPHTDMASGYVRNKSKGYVHPFEFKKNEITHSEVVENVWKELEMGTQDDWTDIVEMTDKPATTVNIDDKENITQNN